MLTTSTIQTASTTICLAITYLEWEEEVTLISSPNQMASSSMLNLFRLLCQHLFLSHSRLQENHQKPLRNVKAMQNLKKEVWNTCLYKLILKGKIPCQEVLKGTQSNIQWSAKKARRESLLETLKLRRLKWRMWTASLRITKRLKMMDSSSSTFSRRFAKDSSDLIFGSIFS